VRKQLFGVVVVFAAFVCLSAESCDGMTCDDLASIVNDSNAYLDSHDHLSDGEITAVNQIAQHAMDRMNEQSCNVSN
jgi:hypothetical protein